MKCVLIAAFILRAMASTKWSCMKVNGAIDAFRINNNGDVECGSLDGTSCDWVKSSSKCDNSPSEALSCGEMHLQLYGITGYDDPNHWCYKVRKVLGPSTTTPVTVAPTIVPTTSAPTTAAPIVTVAPTTQPPTLAPTTIVPSTISPPTIQPTDSVAPLATTAAIIPLNDNTTADTTATPAPTQNTQSSGDSGHSSSMTTVGYVILALGILVCIGAVIYFIIKRRKNHQDQLDSLMWAETHKSLDQQYKLAGQNPYYSEEPKRTPTAATSSVNAATQRTEQSCDFTDEGFDAVMPAFDTIYSNDNSSFLVQENKKDAALLEDLDIWKLDAAQLSLGTLLSQSQDKEIWRGMYDGEVVAVKTMKVHSMEQSTAKFVHEVQLLMKLDCPNIVAMYGVVFDTNHVKDSVQLVFEFMDNGNLEQYLRRTPRHSMHWTEKVQYAIDIVNGLAYLHSRGIIHRDLKCKHVLVNSNMEVKLTDFGGSRETDVFMTQGAGTLRWTAPEVYAGSNYNVAADIYSFGMVLAELETHDTPFANKLNSKGRPLNDFEILQQVQDQTLQMAFPSESPFYIIGTRCVAWDPADRPTPEEITIALKHELTRATMSF
ncbi:kinase [Thraustotheca clavata]|uniref:Kinase n=1 Tax=Thraustotheca clavata TaxID=74557 RepID=A0A1W0A7V5_9STRA|nr:kinase [Thraustotheca clavata]